MVKTILHNALTPAYTKTRPGYPAFTSLKARMRLTRSYSLKGRRSSSPTLCRLDNSDHDSDGNSGRASSDEDTTRTVILPTAVVMTGAVFIIKSLTTQNVYSLENIVDFQWEGQLGGLSIGDLTGAAIWAVALYFVSPWQLLLLFLGRIETERPSDWLLNLLGRGTGQDVEAIDYKVPAQLHAVTIAFFIVSGMATATTLELLLGDATWSISTGIGALFAAGFYEIGRPERLNVAQSQLLEAQWQDFASFANDSLQRRGRCHETEVINAFRKRFGRYRMQSSISDARVRDMIKNWHPGASRSRMGWYKNLSLVSQEQLQPLKVLDDENNRSST